MLPNNDGPGSPIANRVVTNFRVPPHKTIQRVLSHWANASSKYAEEEHHNYGPPSKDVLLMLDRSTGTGCIGPCPPPSVRLHLPLSPDEPWFEQRTAGGAPSFRWGYFRFHHDLYSVTYWIGKDATAKDRAAVLDALRSIGPAS